MIGIHPSHKITRNVAVDPARGVVGVIRVECLRCWRSHVYYGTITSPGEALIVPCKFAILKPSTYELIQQFKFAHADIGSDVTLGDVRTVFAKALLYRRAEHKAAHGR